MGMGEPLLNYRNVLDSIEKITSKDGLGMSPKRITVSTAGIAKLIKKLGDDEVNFVFGSETGSHFYAISIDRARY